MTLTLVSGSAAPRATGLSAAPYSHVKGWESLLCGGHSSIISQCLISFALSAPQVSFKPFFFFDMTVKTQNLEFPDMTENMCSGIQNAKGVLKTEHPEKIG